jgi:hypothetical protein
LCQKKFFSQNFDYFCGLQLPILFGSILTHAGNRKTPRG